VVSNLGTFVAVYWIIGAVLTLRWVAQLRSAPGWRVGSVAGLIGVVVGIMFLVRELLHTFIEEGLLLDLLGLSAVTMGLLRLLGGFHDDQIAGDEPPAIASSSTWTSCLGWHSSSGARPPPRRSVLPWALGGY
jgi:hypothetical protein